MATNNSNKTTRPKNTKRGSFQQETPPQGRRFTPRKRTSESEDDGICDLCVQPIKIHAIGICDHPLCYRCSAKMRVLCEQMHCAVCRVELKKVIYCKSRRPFKEAETLQLIKYKKGTEFFTDEIVKKEYEKLFEHRCPVCPDHPEQFSFDSLESHMRKEHKLFYCHLCVKHNMNFTDECKTYTREDLAKHRRVGDEDDSSHKGHPLCEFCDERYLDNDSLLRHLRRDHYFCHICDAIGNNQYYDGYKDLREHYRREHFLCEEGDCVNEQFTSVYATELDLKAHRTAAHSQSMSRQQQKVERNIDLGFQYANPPARGGRAGRNDNQGPPSGRGRGRGRGGPDSKREEQDLELAKALSLSEKESQKNNNKDFSKLRVERPRVQREPEPKRPPPEEEPPPPNLIHDFPSLVATEPDGPTQLYDSVSAQKEISTVANENQTNRVEPKTSVPTAASKIASAAGRSVGKISDADFPTLGSNNKKTSNAQSTGYWGATVPAPTNSQKSKSKKPAKPVSVNMPQSRSGNSKVNFQSKEDFPSLGGKGPTSQLAAAIPTAYQKPKPDKTPQPVSVNVPQPRSSNNKVNFESKEDFPTLGGKGPGFSQGKSTIWGTTAPAPVQTLSKKQKKQKNKTPVSNTEPVKKPTPKSTPAAVTMNSNLMANDETVSIRIGSGKHSMRLTSAKHHEEISDIEKPVDVPGVGGTSVNTVSADTFSLLSRSSRNTHSNFSDSKFMSQTEEFPELGGGKGGRIRGIGSSTSWGRNNGDTYASSKKTPLSLSDISKDIFPSSTVESIPINSKSESSKTKHQNSNLQANNDSQHSSQPPPLSSYAPNWYDEPELSVADKMAKESFFQAVESDFPTLGGGAGGKGPTTSGKKNKKKKKKAHPTVNDLSKHFGVVNENQNSGHLENLISSETGDAKKSLSSMLDKENVFAPTTNGTNSKDQTTVDEKHKNIVEKQESSSEENVLDPRPDEEDYHGRNMWLINTIQQVCETDENFAEFKSYSGGFRQGTVSANEYYNKCRVLLGRKHFSTVFGELVDLLPDEDKQRSLLKIHRMYKA